LEDSPAAIKEVEEGRADLAVVVGSNLPLGIKAHPLFKDQLQLLFSPVHPWNEKTKLTVRDLRDQHFLLYQRTSATFRQIEEFFLQSGVRLNSYVEIPSFEIMKQLARFGLGVAVMAPWVAAAELEQGSLVALPTPRYRIEREWSVIHQGTREIRQSEQTFIGLCRLACEAFIQ
jgi:DNA-binding transcriptional LysR family regulator